MHSREHARGQHRRGKPRAFLVGPVRHNDRVLGLDPKIIQRANDLKPAKHAQHAVIFPARRLRVQMAPT